MAEEEESEDDLPDNISGYRASVVEPQQDEGSMSGWDGAPLGVSVESMGERMSCSSLDAGSE